MADDELRASPSHAQLRGPLNSTTSAFDPEPADLVGQKLVEWQQRRLERQLRGEYQSKVMRLNELVGGNLDAQLSIANVRIEGAKITRPGFLARVVYPYFDPKPSTTQEAHPSTLETVLHQTRQITAALHRTQVFKSIQPELDLPKDELTNVKNVDLVLKVVERGRLSLKSSTEVGEGDASANASVKLLNAFGGAEEIEGSTSYGMKTAHTYRLGISAPLTGDMLTRGEASVFSVDNDYAGWASCREGLKGLKTGVLTHSTLGTHEFSYQALLRHIHSLKPSASFSIRQAAGTSFKSSFHHVFTHDSRDDSIQGTRGVYLKLSQELAGLGGDTSFAKAEGESQISRRIVKGLHFSLAARAGVLYPLDGKDSMFNDRFKLGGPINIRGFRFHGLGPRDDSDSLGGDLYWAAGLSVISDLPKKPHWPLKPHFYINAGKLGGLNHSLPFPQSLVQASSKPSVSVGIGLIYRFDPLRIELNFGMPLVAGRRDAMQRGFQMGFGVECL